MQNKIFQLQGIETEPIERIEEGENEVRYTNMHLLAPGEWTDAASRETVWYSPDGISNLEVDPDNSINIMHDVDNEVSEIGHIDPETVETTDEGMFADVIVETDNAAGEYADENLQKTLETGGAKGFGGPSVEIRSDDTEMNHSRGVPELQSGLVGGAGFVKNPASKTVSFARQSSKKGVALSQTDKGVYRLSEPMDLSALEQTLSEHGIAVDDKDESELQELAEALGISLADDDDPDDDPEEEENGDNPEDEPEDPEEEPEDEPEDEEPDMSQEEMANAIQSLEERLQNIEDMLEQAAQEQEMSEEIEEATQDLADAETVQELEEAKEELDKRLSELEDEPKKPRTLADGEGTESTDESEGTMKPIAQYDARRGTLSR